MSKAYIIAGGGLAGLFAARTLLALGVDNIYLIEKEPETGGLLQSITAENPLGDGQDFEFDYGTHFALSTSDPDVDSVFYRDIDASSYNQFTDSLPEAHYLNGHYYEYSGCASALSLPQASQEQIYSEIEALVSSNGAGDLSTLEDVLLSKYGASATKEIYVPAFEKLTGTHPAELDPLVENSFFPSRLILKDQQESIALKENEGWDQRIAFARYTDSTSAINKYYPKQGAIGCWLHNMTESLRRDGVHILTGCSIDTIDTDAQNRVQTVTLSDGQTLECQHLIWTLPPIFLSFLTGTKVEMAKPMMRSVAILHYLSDQKPQTDAYWVTVYDPQISAYRVTVYNNFSPDAERGAYRISVEVLHDGSMEGSQDQLDTVFDELKTMSILPSDAQNLWNLYTNKDNAFPLVTPTLKHAQVSQIETLENTHQNVSFVGRRPDGGHGQMAVMRNVYTILRPLTEGETKTGT